MAKQITLANKVSCNGVGLHSGSNVNLTIYPAEAGHGIVFKRLDVEASVSLIPARYDLVTETRLGTTIRNEFGVSVSTIEHLMAALWGAGVDNALITLDGPEVPIMDGSSEPFMFMLDCASLTEQRAMRSVLRILKSVEVRDGLSVARVMPQSDADEGCVIDIEIDFNHQAIQRQHARYDFRDISFKQALSRARTFGFEHEVTAMRSAGLALGGSLDNAIVVGREGVINAEGLRYGDEFVRHKALDCLGDLYLAGYRIEGRFEFTRPGHAINNALLHAIFADKNAYEIVQYSNLAMPAFAASAFVPAPAFAYPEKD